MIKDKIIDNSQVGLRSIKNMPFQWLGSADFGRLVPFHIQELVPTDRVEHCAPRIEMQMLPLASPTFGEISIYVHYFFVPFRLLWDGALDVFSSTGALKGFTAPWTSRNSFNDVYVHASQVGRQRALFKHWTSMGLPPFFVTSRQFASFTSQPVSLMPFIAYNQIWWDFYRNPELISDDAKSSYLGSSWKGQISNMIDYEQILYPKSRSITDTWHAQVFSSVGASPVGSSAGLRVQQNTTASYLDVKSYGSDTSQKMRLIEALTRIAERRALSGKRQIDLLYSSYGVKPEWSKLNMCQYLGGAKSDVLISDITSTADTLLHTDTYNTGSPLGFKAGAGYCALDSLDIDYTAQEHGYLFGMFSIVPKVHFTQGLFKHWSHINRDDFFRKELEHTGLVAIRKDEVGVQGFSGEGFPSYNPESDGLTYAFTQPYYEYTYNPDILAGDFMYYHSTLPDPDQPSDGDGLATYMQSMEMFIDFPNDRSFTASALDMDKPEFNKVFYYLGGSTWDDTDDHFHVRVNTGVRLNRPMDGFAVPTVETTQDPHVKDAPVGQSTTL